MRINIEQYEGKSVMHKSWVPLECIDCEEQWEQSPGELPAPDSDFECDQCGTNRPISEFVKTQQGLQILKQFHRQ